MLDDNPLGDTRRIVALLDDLDQAATPEERAAAGLALQVESHLQWAAIIQRERHRILGPR